MICEIYHKRIFILWKKNAANKKLKYNIHQLIKYINPLLKQTIENRKELGSVVHEISKLF